MIKYFSAVAHGRGLDSVKRHETYIAALESEGVISVLGRFKSRLVVAGNVDPVGSSQKKKETDVNIAINMVADAYDDRFDVCYLISADTDLVPPLQLIKAKLPDKQIVAVSPPNRPHGQHIRNIAHRSLKLNAQQLARCTLPDSFELDGKQMHRPPKYR